MKLIISTLLFFIFCSGLVEGKEIEFKHMKNVRQCQICHVSKTSSKLKLLTGESVDESEPQKVCAQCHGLVMRDWEQAIHGKKTGSWQKNGVKLTCVKCHDPHSPRFPQMKAWPAPLRPRLGIEKEKKDGAG